jgi:hypothetical protein
VGILEFPNRRQRNGGEKVDIEVGCADGEVFPIVTAGIEGEKSKEQGSAVKERKTLPWSHT